MVADVGIRAHGHLTADARHFIERADEVVCVISDQIAERMLRDLRPDARSLHPGRADRSMLRRLGVSQGAPRQAVLASGAR